MNILHHTLYVWVHFNVIDLNIMWIMYSFRAKDTENRQSHQTSIYTYICIAVLTNRKLIAEFFRNILAVSPFSLWSWMSSNLSLSYLFLFIGINCILLMDMISYLIGYKCIEFVLQSEIVFRFLTCWFEENLLTHILEEIKSFNGSIFKPMFLFCICVHVYCVCLSFCVHFRNR